MENPQENKTTEDVDGRIIEHVAPSDPNYSADRTVLEDPHNFTIKHPLQNSWTLWYDNPGKKTSQTSWADNLKKVVTFSTVEDFWSIFNNVRPASKLIPGSNYHLFKENIEPKWEHVENVRGGKWIITVKDQKDLLDKMWLWSVLACIGESYEEGGEICGMVVSIRKPSDRLALWTKTATNEVAQRNIGAKLKQVLELPENAIVGYQCHQDSLKRNSSFNNRNRYAV
eukprot:TRINITY_DN5553_c0_g2_i1.p1 TRINITY_DN5553_c0_g2~~TRINITY_DN5553_c0_g2_i1.p1  ORF type:complete len:246 (+),score=49.11 TRINITY_DN5553_c0_g2_i1:59-739(+)